MLISLVCVLCFALIFVMSFVVRIRRVASFVAESLLVLPVGLLWLLLLLIIESPSFVSSPVDMRRSCYRAAQRKRRGLSIAPCFVPGEKELRFRHQIMLRMIRSPHDCSRHGR